MGLIPPHLLEQIRAANDIVDVVGASVPLKRAGSNFRGLCPFHREKTPSFNVNPANQIFKCFGCGKGGDVFTFVREYEGLDFMAAVRRLAERASIKIEFDDNPVAQQQKHNKEVLWNIHEQITVRWQSALANEAGGQIARDYLAKRGVTAEAIKLFRLGAAPESWDDTVNWAKSKGHDLAVMEQAGLVVRKEGSDRPYDRFRGRLIFPICDEQGRVIAFSGRILSGDEKQAKYVNSPETPIFTKGKVFFGIDKSKRPMLDAESAIICEGQLDLMACYMAGVQNVVAPQGTALTPDHARILKRYVEEAVLCFDADNAGQNAAIRSLDSLLNAGLAIRVATIPNGKDPDDFIKQYGGEAFRKIIEQAEGFFDWYLKRLCVTNDPRTDKGRVAVLREMSEAIAKTRNAVLVDLYAQKTARTLGVSEQSARLEFQKQLGGGTKKESDTDDDLESTNDASKISPEEKVVLKVLLQSEDSDEMVAWVSEALRLEWVKSNLIREIITERLTLRREEKWEGIPSLSIAASEDVQSLITHVLSDQGAGANHEDGLRLLIKPKLIDRRRQIIDSVNNLRNDYFAAELQRLTRELAHPDMSDEQRTELLHRQKDLRAQKQQPLL